MDEKLQDKWQSGDPYEFYMGRWSKRVAERFLDWLSINPRQHWLDIGCGSGALSEAIIERQQPTSLTALDQSDGFLLTAKKRLGDNAIYKIGNAMSLPLNDNAVDVAVSGLVLNFIPDWNKALSELRRVIRKEGIAAAYIWDYAGNMELLNHFWDVATTLFPESVDLHEGRRFPDANAEKLESAFKKIGFLDVATSGIEIETHFHDFNDYWLPFLGGQGPAPTFVSKLEQSDKNKLKMELQNKLHFQQDGSIAMKARAWAVKGRK